MMIYANEVFRYVVRTSSIKSMTMFAAGKMLSNLFPWSLPNLCHWVVSLKSVTAFRYLFSDVIKTIVSSLLSYDFLQCNGMNPYGKTLEELNGGEFDDARDVPFCNANAGAYYFLDS